MGRFVLQICNAELFSGGGMLASGKSDCSDLFKRAVRWSDGVMRWRKRGGGLASLWFQSGSPCSDLFVVVEGWCTVSLRWVEDGGSSLVATNVGNGHWRWMAYLHSGFSTSWVRSRVAFFVLVFRLFKFIWLLGFLAVPPL